MDTYHLIDLYILDVCQKANETPGTYRGKLARFTEWLSGKHIEFLAKQDLDAFRTNLQSRKTKNRGKAETTGKLSPFTIRSVCVTVRGFLRWCYQHGHLQADLASSWKIPGPPRPEPKAIDQYTFDQLLQAACQVGQTWEKARNLAMLYVLRDSGSRIGCVLQAEINDIDWLHHTIWGTSKGKTYPIFFSTATAKILGAWLQLRHQAGPADYKIFTGAKGTGLTRSGVYHVLTRLAEQGHIEGRHNPHAFRHAFARDSLLNGADLSQVSQLMVHSSIVVTADYYARWDNKELQKVHSQTSPGRLLPDPPQLE